MLKRRHYKSLHYYFAYREDNFRRGLEASTLRFSYQDGSIEHICTATREEPWVMNIKKGVLSAFQNNMDSLKESQNVTEVMKV